MGQERGLGPRDMEGNEALVYTQNIRVSTISSGGRGGGGVKMGG